MVDDDLTDLARDLSLARFHRGHGQTAEIIGAENTARGRAVSDKCLLGLELAIAAYKPYGGTRATLWAVLGRLKPECAARAIFAGAVRICGFDAFDPDAQER